MRIIAAFLIIFLTPALSSAQQTQFLCLTKKGAITTRLKCKSGETKLNASNLGALGLQGPKGDTGPSGEQGPQGPVSSGTISSGQTITGILGETMFPGSVGASASIVVDYGVKVAEAPTSEHIVVKANAALTSACGSDACLNSSDRDASAQAACTGTADAPTAPAGYVCIYPLSLLDVANNLQGHNTLNTKFGFQVFWIVGSGLKTSFIGTWAYTAP